MDQLHFPQRGELLGDDLLHFCFCCASVVQNVSFALSGCHCAVPRPSDQKHTFENYSKSCGDHHRVLTKITSGRQVAEANGRHGHYDVVYGFKDAADCGYIHFEFHLIAQEHE